MHNLLHCFAVHIYVMPLKGDLMVVNEHVPPQSLYTISPQTQYQSRIQFALFFQGT